MMKRIITVIIALILLLAMAASDSYAIGPETSNLTVVMEYGDRPLAGINVAVCRVAEPKEGSSGVIYSATQEFAGAEADFTNLTDGKNVAMAAILNAHASKNGIRMTTETTGSNGKAYFYNLPAGLYLVAQRNGENSLYTIAPYLVAVPRPNAAGDGWDYNIVSYPKSEPVKRDPELISVNVFKIWKGTDSPPNNILVQLYQNGRPYGNIVSINASNYWHYTWDSLESGYAWTVDEIDVPSGFTKKISGDNNTGFIITNTKTPDGPDDQSGGNSDNQSGKQSGGKGGGKGATPKTGDTSNTPLWIMMMITSAFGVLILVLQLPAFGRKMSKQRRM